MHKYHKESKENAPLLFEIMIDNNHDEQETILGKLMYTNCKNGIETNPGEISIARTVHMLKSAHRGFGT